MERATEDIEQRQVSYTFGSRATRMSTKQFWVECTASAPDVKLWTPTIPTHQTLDIGYCTLDIGHRILDIEHWTLHVRSWTFDGSNMPYQLTLSNV